MKMLIITGGNINKEFLQKHLEKNQYNKIIAADKGLETLNEINVTPDTSEIDYGIILLKNNILPSHCKKFIEYLK